MTSHKPHSVSILILMDVCLKGEIHHLRRGRHSVSILILMDVCLKAEHARLSAPHLT